MKYKFNFIQIANWLYVCRNNLSNTKNSILEEKMSKSEAVEKLQAQKRQLLLIKDIINRKAILHGVQRDFLLNYNKLKEQYGIEE
jgi:predicted hydrolase (HD superfamily)